MRSKEEKIPIKKAILWLFCSVVLVLIPVGLGYAYYQYLQKKRSEDASYHIVAIVQKENSHGDMLKAAYFAELLQLSVDKPTNLFNFDVKLAERKLAANPLIKEIKLSRIQPGTLFIDYQLRQPIAYIEDYSNAAMDKETVLIPFKPFFTPKKLPTLCLGRDDCQEAQIDWGKCLNSDKVDLALSVLRYMQADSYFASRLRKVDVSQAYASSYGKREIVVLLEEGGWKPDAKKTYLRLPQYDYEQQLANYKLLAKRLGAELPTVVDLRIPKLAFMTK